MQKISHTPGFNLYKCPFSAISISLDIMPSLDGEQKRWSKGELAGN